MNYHQSNADKAAKTAEMNMLLRGKTSEQEAIIRFFYGAQGGCLSKGGISLRQYLEKVEAKLASLDTKQMALNKLGLEEKEVSEIAPICFEGFHFSNKIDNLVAKTPASTWVSSEYQITWFFFGSKELFLYQYTFNMINDSKKENTVQYFYQDVTNFSTSTETYQKIVGVPDGGCTGGITYMQVSADSDEFKIVVPGDVLRCPMIPSDQTEAAIRGMREKLRERKNQIGNS